ncbi:MAG: DUF4399 domain-containing protein [Chloroflexota bacterium]
MIRKNTWMQGKEMDSQGHFIAKGQHRLALRLMVGLLIGSLVLLGCGGRNSKPEQTNTPESAPILAPTVAPTVAPTQKPAEEPDDVAEAAPKETDAKPAAEMDEDVKPNVFFKMPLDGAIVPPTFQVVMNAAGVAVDPAGDIIENSGHMHILVDTDFVPAGEVIPNDEQHLHYGDGSLMTELTLTPGPHTLRLQLANGAHIALNGDEYRDEIIVMVSEDAPDQSVGFVMPADGAVVPETFDVQMTAAGLFVDPAGDIVENSGHFHILVNTDFIPAGEVIPNDEQHLHFGGAQTMTTLTLEPGEYTLRLQLANGAHIALDGEQYRAEIQISVGENTESAVKNDYDEDTADENTADEDTADEDTSNEDVAATVRAPEELWVSMACSACHKLDQVQSADNFGQPGPHMANLFETAGSRVEGQSAIKYIVASIVEPNAYINEGYVANVMPQNFAEKMSEEEIARLAEWVLNPN